MNVLPFKIEGKKKRFTVFMSHGALIYAKCHDFDQGIITHYTTDEKFLLYHFLRKEIPSICILYDTRRDLEKELSRFNYHVKVG
jgi:hypothetical protein